MFQKHLLNSYTLSLVKMFFIYVGEMSPFYIHHLGFYFYFIFLNLILFFNFT